MPDATPAPAAPSATVILLRDVDDHIEALLLRRNSKLAFHGGAWVFPGGRIDPEDFLTRAPDDQTAAARQAAVREAKEEADLDLETEELVQLSHWTTPVTQPRRFSTWFFIAAAGQGRVQVDGGDIDAHRWARPAEALASQRQGEIELPPPTFVTLLKLAAFQSSQEALAQIAAETSEVFTPRNTRVPGGVCSLYAEDAGYDEINVDESGPRHRLWMIESGWRYERAY